MKLTDEKAINAFNNDLKLMRCVTIGHGAEYIVVAVMCRKNKEICFSHRIEFEGKLYHTGENELDLRDLLSDEWEIVHDGQDQDTL